MFVRQLIGSQAGEIIEMPYLAAQNCLAVGTVEAVTEEERVAAGLKPAEDESLPKGDTIPPGYRIEPCIDLDEDDKEFSPGGFDVFDAGGVRLSAETDLPHLAAAREFAWDHYERDQEAAKQPEGSAPAEPTVEIEWNDGWREAHWMTQVKLAKQFDEKVSTKGEAVEVLEAQETKRKEEAAANNA